MMQRKIILEEGKVVQAVDRAVRVIIKAYDSKTVYVRLIAQGFENKSADIIEYTHNEFEQYYEEVE